MRGSGVSRRAIAGLALLPLFCRAAGAVESGDQARIEQEAVKAYLAKDQAEKIAASDALVARNAAALYNNPSSGFLGNPKGDVAIVQFFDYDCGFSKRVEPRVEALLKTDPGVKLIPREFTIEPAESSPIAGRAACFAAPGCGKAGLRTNEPTRRIEATSSNPLATGYDQEGGCQATIGSSAARHASPTQSKARAATIE